jgi:hypothetical protein
MAYLAQQEAGVEEEEEEEEAEEAEEAVEEDAEVEVLMDLDLARNDRKSRG